MRRCDDLQEDPGVKCIICFAGGEQIRDLCALAHYSSHDIFELIFIGPTDPSARSWLPENCQAMGIPMEIARKMANDVESSFLAKRDNVL
ncbi:MAG: hypothetical protein WAW52_13125 [Methanothrix sp.]